MTGGSHTGAGTDPQATDAAQASEAPERGASDDVVAEQGPSGGPADDDEPGATAQADEGASMQDAEASEGGADELAEPTLEERLTAAEALADEHWNGRLRLQAELENQRKRALRDVQNARKFGLEPLLNDLLPVIDSLEMGLQASRGENVTVESLREGTEITLNMFSTMLQKHGIAEVNPAGEKFDPEFHQAMSMQEVEGAAPNTVVQVLQKGYTLNERLLRPALVMVAK